MHIISTYTALQVLLSCVQKQDLNIYKENCVLLRKIWGDQNCNASTWMISEFSRIDMYVLNIDIWLSHSIPYKFNYVILFTATYLINKCDYCFGKGPFAIRQFVYVYLKQKKTLR